MSYRNFLLGANKKPVGHTLWTWGKNEYYGQLGDGTVVNRSSPVSVVGGFTDWVQAAGGEQHTVGVREDGTAWTWGLNDFGQLGTNNTTNRSSPVSVVGGFTDWCQVSGGYRHTAGLREDGTAWGWGYNFYGQLGTNDKTDRSSPVSVVGGFTDWCQVSAGGHYTIGLRQNGTLWAWGRNEYGQLGTNNTSNRSSPVSVVGGFTDWVQVSANWGHSIGVRENGTLWAWGYNGWGQLGDNTTTTRSSPVSVVGGFTDWVQVSTSNSHTVGLREDGTLWAWGDNSRGQLGDGTSIDSASPVSVVGGFTDWVQVSAGAVRTVGLREDGTLWAWGNNIDGDLGVGDPFWHSSPVLVVGGFTDWTSVSNAAWTMGIRKTR